MSSGKFRSKANQAKHKNMGDHDPSQCNHMLNGKLIHHKPLTAIEGKELVKMYDAEGTRYLIVPNRKPIDLPGILPKSELERLKNQAHVITHKDRMAMIEEAERKRQQLEDESNKRKDMLQKSLITRAKQGGKLSNVEMAAKAKNEYLLQRAHELRQEQEDEVKKANGVILATKCRAIRNAQIAEKKLMEKELDEEEKRLDSMMEQTRQKSLQREQERKEAEEKKNQRYVKEVMEQIKERELQRLMEAERTEEESRMINKALIAMQKEEEQKLQERHERQMQMRKELREANEDIEHYKLIQKEEERIADMRVQEFMRKKAEREAAREAELAAERAAKEREIARLRAQQERAQDQQAALDELNALRIQEEVEREWREKEKENARKKKQQQIAMQMGRQQQIEDLRKAQAIELARDEQEFYQVAKVQNELRQKDIELRKKRREEALCHRQELLSQINEKERERITKIQEKFEEGNALRLEQKIQDQHVKEYLKNKIEKLRENNVPEIYVNDIKRQLKLNV